MTDRTTETGAPEGSPARPRPGEELGERRLKVVAVHAHPDDETLATGVALAHHVGRGDLVHVITCTLGEEGEVIPPELAHLEGDPTTARRHLAASAPHLADAAPEFAAAADIATAHVTGAPLADPERAATLAGRNDVVWLFTALRAGHPQGSRPCS